MMEAVSRGETPQVLTTLFLSTYGSQGSPALREGHLCYHQAKWTFSWGGGGQRSRVFWVGFKEPLAFIMTHPLFPFSSWRVHPPPHQAEIIPGSKGGLTGKRPLYSSQWLNGPLQHPLCPPCRLHLNCDQVVWCDSLPLALDRNGLRQWAGPQSSPPTLSRGFC